MEWDLPTSINDCRITISDGPTDKLRYRKQVIGQVDGVNLIYKTFEMRRVSPFVGATQPIGIYVNDAPVAVTSEDLASGEVYLTVPPNEGDRVRGTYYVQWYTDAEMTQFLVSAAEWILSIDDSTQITMDLRPAAKAYVAHQAYKKVALRFAENLAETYQLFDAPDGKRFDPVSAYNKMANDELKNAFELRDDVYKDRKGQAKAPRFGTISGRTRDVAPKR